MEVSAEACLYEQTFLGPLSDLEKLATRGAQHMRVPRCPRWSVEVSGPMIVLGQLARRLELMSRGHLAHQSEQLSSLTSTAHLSPVCRR
ncbi:hypothetical protein MTO96_028664 [Rhipicephalus appendiculatus]